MLSVDHLSAELHCATCRAGTVINLPELIRPARHERFGRRFYYSPETRLIDWPKLGERHCPLCGGDVQLVQRGYVRSRASAGEWAADRWRRAKGVLVAVLHVIARTPIDPMFTPEVYRVRSH